MNVIEEKRKPMRHEMLTGVILVLCTVLSTSIASTSLGEHYLTIWEHQVGSHTLSQWINEGLMAVFFLLVGLELKREVLYGTLRSIKKSMTPIAAAIGGMVVPACFYILFNWNSDTLSGFGIPMSTDIAFVMAIIGILGTRIPVSLKTMLTAMAVIDDLGAVIIIALFYTKDFSIPYLLLALLLFVTIFFAGQLIKPKTKRREHLLTAFILLCGIGIWFLVMASGIHASVTGLLIALAIPSFTGAADEPAALLESRLHRPVYFIILPLFVLCNTAIPISQLIAGSSFEEFILQPHIMGIFVGLLLGKPLGIVMGTWYVLWRGYGELPAEIGSRQIIGAGFLGGIGFTMAIFIGSLSFQDLLLEDSAKIAIMATSVVSATIGTILLSIRPKTDKKNNTTSTVKHSNRTK